jgi:hypothetical protein
VEKKHVLTAAFVFTFLISAVAEMQFINVGKSNPLPNINPLITIENTQNATYSVNTVTLNFTVESNWDVYSCFYSLDGQKMEPIENMSIISEESFQITSSITVTRTILKGSCLLFDLSEGEHNVTVYLITDHEISGIPSKYEKGDILYSATNEFIVDTPPFPTTLVVTSVITVAVIGVGLLFYFKKRKR